MGKIGLNDRKMAYNLRLGFVLLRKTKTTTYFHFVNIFALNGEETVYAKMRFEAGSHQVSSEKKRTFYNWIVVRLMCNLCEMDMELKPIKLQGYHTIIFFSFYICQKTNANISNQMKRNIWSFI